MVVIIRSELGGFTSEDLLLQCCPVTSSVCIHNQSSMLGYSWFYLAVTVLQQGRMHWLFDDNIEQFHHQLKKVSTRAQICLIVLFILHNLNLTKLSLYNFKSIGDIELCQCTLQLSTLCSSLHVLLCFWSWWALLLLLPSVCFLSREFWKV